MKLVCEVTINGEDQLKVLTTPTGMTKFTVATVPGVGKPFWAWASIPAGTVVAADFTNAPIATSDPVQNQALIDAITAQPQDVLEIQT